LFLLENIINLCTLWIHSVRTQFWRQLSKHYQNQLSLHSNKHSFVKNMWEKEKIRLSNTFSVINFLFHSLLLSSLSLFYAKKIVSLLLLLPLPLSQVINVVNSWYTALVSWYLHRYPSLHPVSPSRLILIRS